MNRIAMLSPLLANQIAAGEVVERPASIVKELLENSLDAGATQLDIHLIGGGRQLIRIQDNGSGIHPEDIPLALARHATSKILHPADLAQIGTLGFRGEALASIASIARVKITSQHEDFDALCASAQGREMAVTIYPAAHPRGTTIEVADIFFNTPARRKFLKSERTEFLHIEETIKRMAVARPDVGFSLFHDNKLVKRYVQVAHDPVLRIEQVFSKSFMHNAMRVEHEISAFKIEGWLADLGFARSSNDMQYCFVNGRMVRDKMLSHAIRLAFEDKIYPGRYPAYVLYLTCDHAAVDVNVHPTKHEVRFREARTVHDFVLSSLQKVLSPVVMAPTPRHCEEASTPRHCEERSDEATHTSSTVDAFAGLRPSRNDAPHTVSLGRVITVLDQRVVILQKDTMLRVVNWAKTLQNYVLSRWSYFLKQETKPMVPLLSPIHVIHENAEAYIAKLSKLGCHAQIIGPNHLIMRELPRFLQGLPETAIYPALLQEPIEAIQQEVSRSWGQAQSLNHRDIERLLESVHALSPDLISSKDYVPEMLI